MPIFAIMLYMGPVTKIMKGFFYKLFGNIRSRKLWWLLREVAWCKNILTCHGIVTRCCRVPSLNVLLLCSVWYFYIYDRSLLQNDTIEAVANMNFLISIARSHIFFVILGGISIFYSILSTFHTAPYLTLPPFQIETAMSIGSDLAPIIDALN